MSATDNNAISHGILPTLKKLSDAIEKVSDVNDQAALPFSFAITRDTSRFDYLFPALQVPGSLLPEAPETREALVALGMSMREPDGDTTADSLVPSIYTYLGQFVDHDITLEAKSDGLVFLSDPNLKPLTIEEIRTKITNGRQPDLDLDNVYYKPAPRSRSNLVVGSVTPVTQPGHPPPFEPVPGKDLQNDLPRRPRNTKDQFDRAALIGDARNDENLIVAQLHVAFVRAHNAIAAQGHTFDEARTILRQHYQWIVIKDFLPRICDPWIVNSILNSGNKWFRPGADELFMPLEFSVAAYRFGHSMVRSRYDINLNFRSGTAATLADLFQLTALSGDLKGKDTLPDNWIVEWENFVERGTNRARPIDTRLTRDLFDLKPMPVDTRLSVRNLLRGYLMRLPTGQAVAGALNLPVMTAAEIQQVARSVSQEQLQAVQVNGFSERTPLWYYILAEAAAGQSGRLGSVGSTIVAEVLIGLVRGSKDSILRKQDWQPWLGTSTGQFEVRDLLKLADVLN
jgi:Animal haem peroxidase